MPFHISNLGTHLLVTFEGRIVPQDLERFADEAEVVEDALPHALDRIGDLTRVTEFNVGFTEMRVLAVRRRARTFDRNIRTALVAGSPVQVGMARMFQALNDNPQIELRVVSTLEEALRWLQVPGDAVTGPPQEGERLG